MREDLRACYLHAQSVIFTSVLKGQVEKFFTCPFLQLVSCGFFAGYVEVTRRLQKRTWVNRSSRLQTAVDLKSYGKGRTSLKVNSNGDKNFRASR
jgi:hypothetical protein